MLNWKKSSDKTRGNLDMTMTPLEKAETLYDELVSSYQDGDKREIRAASKLLMVALAKMQEHGGFGWQGLVEEYLIILNKDPQKFRDMMDSNRGHSKKSLN